jgi:hypothetical protein
MSVTVRSSNFAVTVNDRELLRRIERAGGKTALSRIATTLKREADALEEDAKREWPVSYGYDNRRREKRGQPHSRDLFAVKGRLTAQVVSYSIVNTAPYAYYIRSYQIGEAENASRQRYFWPKGMDRETHRAKMTVGRKRHAWTTLVVRPANRRSKKLADEVGDDLQKLMQGR